MGVRKVFRDGVHIKGTDYMEIPVGTTAQRTDPGAIGARAAMRVNSDTALLEWWDSGTGTWKDPGGAKTYTIVGVSNAGTAFNLQPQHRYWIGTATSNGDIIVDKDEWEVGDVTYVGVSNAYNFEEFEVRFSSATGQDIAFNNVRIDSVALNSSYSDYVYLNNSHYYLRLEYVGDDHFMVDLMRPSTNEIKSVVTRENIITSANPNLVPGMLNKINTANGWSGAGNANLPNPGTLTTGTKIYVVDEQNSAFNTLVGIACATGQQIDHVIGGGPVHFHYQGEMIEFTSYGNRWVTGRYYGHDRYVPAATNTQVISNDAAWHRTGHWIGTSLNTTNAFGAGGWFAPNVYGPVINEAFEVRCVSNHSPRPGVNRAAIAPVRQYLRFIASGREFTRYIATDGSDQQYQYRSVAPIGATYSSVADAPVLEIMPSPHTTFTLEEDAPVSIGLCRQTTQHAWVKGDKLDIVNYSGAVITIDSQGIGPSGFALIDELGNSTGTGAVMDVKGTLSLTFTGTAFKVLHRVYY